MSEDRGQLVERVAAALLMRGQLLAVAESCTGGLVGAACTAVAGASRWFERGYVTYSNPAKTEMLGVPATLIAAHGAVSAEVAAAMARGALANSGADVAVAITGVAGPDGGTPAKPVGTVWLAVAEATGPTTTELLNAGGDRTAIRAAAVEGALALVLERLAARPIGP